jgi:hypothetical protein
MTNTDDTDQPSARSALATREEISDSVAPVRQFTAEQIAQWEAENTTALPRVRPEIIAGQRRKLAFEAARARPVKPKKKA